MKKQIISRVTKESASIKKQLVSAVAIGILAIGSAVSVSAGSYSAAGTDWEKTVPSGNPDNYIRVVTEADGNHTMSVSAKADGWVRLNRKIKASGADYRYSLKFKEVVKWYDSNIRIAEKTGGRWEPADVEIGASGKIWSHTPIEGMDGWYDSTAKIWYYNENDTYLNILTEGWGAMRLDDINVVDASNQLLLYDDFETEIENVTPGQNSLSWTVPENVVYKELKVYRNNTLVKTLAYGVNTLSADDVNVPFNGTWQLKPVKTVEITNWGGSKENRDVEMDGVKVNIRDDMPWTTVQNAGNFSVITESNGNHCWKATGNATVKKQINLTLPNKGIGEYIFKLKAKVIGEPTDSTKITWGINDSEDKYTISGNNWVKTDVGNGWTEYTYTLDPWVDDSSNKWNYTLTMNAGGDGVEVLVDDLSIVGTNSSKVLYEDCEPSVHYEYTEELASLSANGNSNNIVLTWNNPNRSDITGFKVYEGSNEISVSETLSNDAYALNTVTITPGDDNVHTYRVDMTAGGKTYSTTISGQRSNGTGQENIVSYLNNGYTKDGYNLEGMRVTGFKAGGNLPYGSVALDTKNKYSGNSSLRINPNYASHWDSGIWLKMQIPNTSAEKTYKLTYMEKYDHVDNSTLDATNKWVNTLFTTNYDNVGAMPSDWSTKIAFCLNNDGTYSTKWHQREFTFTGGQGELYFKVPFKAQNVWLDDIEVYEVDAEGNTTGGNLVVNGGFEYKLDNLAFDGSTLTWSVPDGANYDRIDIVTTTNGLTETYSVNPTNGTYTLPAFNGSEQTIDVYGVRVGGTEYKTKFGSYARENDFYIAPASFDTVTKNDDDTYTTVTEGISNTQAGLVRSNVTIKNNKLEMLSCDVYTAVYNSDDVLVKVDKMKSEIAKGAQATVGSVIDVPSADNTIKTFVWDAGTVTPKANASVLPAASAN